MKKILALVLALSLLCGLMVTVHADDKIKIGEGLAFPEATRAGP